jgi:N-acetylmuramoyl-L-alanine amidase
MKRLKENSAFLSNMPKLLLGVFLLISTVGAQRGIQSVSISEKKDTTIVSFEIHGDFNFEPFKTQEKSLKLIFNLPTCVTTINPLGIIKNVIIVNKDSARSTFEFIFKESQDFYFQKSESGLILKAYPKLIRKIRRVVIDPGHGGIDPGAISKSGIKEKNINLQIARLLKKQLEKEGLEVYLTRSDDEFVPLAARTNFANKIKADLFISIHCNSSAANKYASGFETYFLSEARTDLERAALLRENEALKYESDFSNKEVSLDLVLADLYQTEQLTESYNLALQIQTQAVKILKGTDRGVRQAGFFVLRGAFMPAVLIECGFLSNRSEAQRLTNPNYQNLIIKAISEGVMNYVKDYNRRNSQ